MSEGNRRLVRTLTLLTSIVGAGVVVSAQIPAYATEPTLRCSGRTATIMGTAGNDRLVGTPRRDVIVGLGGEDIIRGEAGNDVLCGGGGIDRLYGGRGADEVIDHSELSTLFGGRGNDLLRSTGEYNDLFGGRGDDRILAPVSGASGGPGDDILRGSRLNGGAGNDRLTGTFKDYDEFIGGPGWDVIDGRGTKGIGQDFVYHHKASTGVLVDMRRGVVRGPSIGRDILVGHDYHVIGSEHADVFIGGRWNDSFDGLGSRDELRGRGGADRLLGGEGRDGIWGGRGGDDIRGADCYGGLRSGGGPLCRPVSEDRGDVMRGGPGDDDFEAGDGNDLILGRRGDDRAWNDGGDDVLRGGRGSDRLFSALGDDRYVGGRGFDVAGFEYCHGGVEASLVTRSASGCGSDTMRGIEGLFGTDSSDVLVGDDRRNLLHGSFCCSFGGEQDQLVAKGGNDLLMTSGGGQAEGTESESYVFDGGAGTDTASFADLWHDDVDADLMTGFAWMRSSGALAVQLISIEGLVGSRFDDVLRGDGAGNSLVGLKGSDSIEGRGGDDTLRGGTGWVGSDGRRRKSGETDQLDGGSGTDRCTGAETSVNCESEPERAR